jgi:tetratricopeptide (TPR) repeat protein
VQRLLDHYLHAAAAAAAEFETPASRQGLRLGDPRRPDLVGNAGRKGREWLEVERSNLVRLVHAAADHGLHQYAWRLARACARFFYLHGYIDDLLDTHHRALPSANALGAPTAVAMLHNYLAAAYYRIGDYRRAVTSLEVAIDLHARSDDEMMIRISRQVNLASVYYRLGEHSEALRLARDSLSVARRLDWTHGMAIALGILGSTYASLGRLSEALDSHRMSLFLWVEMRLAMEAAISLGNIGHVRARLGHHTAARRLLTVALREKRRHNNRYGVAETLNDLAVVHRTEGRVRDSLALHEEALAGMRDVGDWHGECLVLNQFARSLHLAGDVSAAVRLYRQALTLAEHHNHRYRQADAHNGLAACLATRDQAAARGHWEQALTRYRELDLPQQFGVEDQLRRLARHGGAAGRQGVRTLVHDDREEQR